jgi:uncharacterized OB-fold protein
MKEPDLTPTRFRRQSPCKNCGQYIFYKTNYACVTCKQRRTERHRETLKSLGVLR